MAHEAFSLCAPFNTRIMTRPFLLITALIALTLGLTGFSSNKKKLKKRIGAFVLINTEMADSATAVNLPKTYYLFEKEVTNLYYREFLYYIKNNNPEELAEIEIDTAAWSRSTLNYPEAFQQHYHEHEAYNEYPVVNISKAAAERYCTWLGEMLKETYLKDVDFEYEIRLPTKAEWQFAASGGLSQAKYSWGGPYIYNKKGQRLCAFNNLGAENIFRNSETGELEVRFENSFHNEVMGQPVKTGSFAENGFGLFDMCGNVAEMCSDDTVALGGHWNAPGGGVQIKSEMPYDGTPNSYVGFRPVLVIK
jgi:formylglycine-generating enzyme required for sulfatase activity